MGAVRMLVVFLATYGVFFSGPFVLRAGALSSSCAADCRSKGAGTVCDASSPECARENPISQPELASEPGSNDNTIPPWILVVAAMGVTVSVGEYVLSARRGRPSADRAP